MIAFIIVLLMIFETTFLDAQAKYRSVLDAETHRRFGEHVSLYRRRV
jgi:hypothetical protein